MRLMQDEALAKTAAAVPVGAKPGASDVMDTLAATSLNMTTRSAVLPHAASGDLPAEPRERYAKKRILGAGGMGEVVLAEDRDIGRDVALKYLTAPSEDKGALARFVDEIRVVGSLEHPNIVPIHDVGVDAESRYYFVMKHVEGETLEHVIERLAAGDAAYHARYTTTARVQIFIALLRALAFAHERGYVHRDIKPANVMVGRFGEVMLMDWGVAKRCKAPEDAASGVEPDDEAKSMRERLFTTRRGAIVGTPAYMSPEQARGDVEAIDERSDVYCATALFYELMSLQHYLGDRPSLKAMLDAIQNEPGKLSFSEAVHPVFGPTPAEALHFSKKGLQKKPEDRYQTVGEMIDILENNLDGRVAIQCPFTLQKRVTRELARMTDRHPIAFMWGFIVTASAVIGLVAWALRIVTR
jgi:serine/threonine protein kinase